MTVDTAINSNRYWNQRFAQDWEQLAGPSQSGFFATLALSHLPDWLLEALSRDQLTLADWGCAQGDGTAVWLTRMDATRLVGIDFSAVAIAQARERYPQIAFLVEDWLADSPPSGARYDLVFSSNTLEHFEQAFEALDTLSRAARQAVMLALPYRELDRIDEHFFTFLPDNLPAVLPNGFRLVWSRVVDCTLIPDTQWSGEQIVLVYAQPDWVAGLRLALDDVRIERDDPATRAAAHRREVEQLLDGERAAHDAAAQRQRLREEQLEGEAHRLQVEYQQLQREATQTREQLDSILHSRSWTLTAPLRWLMGRARQITQGPARYRFYRAVYWKLPAPVRQALGGWRQRVVQRAQQDGWSAAAAGEVAGPAVTPAWVLTAQQHTRIAIIPCGFEFDELVNQRPINAAKCFAAAGYFVVFVAWQWRREDVLARGCGPVWPGVHQVPLFEFMDVAALLPAGPAQALYLLTLPAPPLVALVPLLRSRGFAVVYDIMDEWEAFARAGQAPWYEADVERALVLQADAVTAVAPSLVRKFADLRTDIACIGNGFSPALLGLEQRGVAGTRAGPGQRVGYVGHLTDAWFDWSLVLELATAHPHIDFDIIGYGEPEWVRQPAARPPNLHLVGKVAPQQLHEYVSTWQAGLIPFVEGPLAQAVDPIKIYEYLYFGLPTFVTGITHLQACPGVTVTRRDDAVPAFGRFLADFPWPAAEVDTFLAHTTWEARFEALVRCLDTRGLKDLYGV